VNTPTPQEREERIAELRARRRARLRWLALRAVFVAGALVLLGALGLYWLLTTVGGRDALLAQVTARLPPGASFTWRDARGPAAGPLVLRGVRFSLPRQLDPACVARPDAPCTMGTIVFTADTLVLDPALRPLLGRRLRLDALDVRGATLALPESRTPFEFPRWPDVLPRIAPPLGLQADRIRVDGLRVTRAGEPLVTVRSLRGGLRASDGALHLAHLVADTDRGRFTAHGDYVPRDNYRSDLVATAELPSAGGTAPVRLGYVARGDLARMDVALAGNAPSPLRITLTLRGADTPRWRLQARSEEFDPALLAGDAPSTPLAFTLDANGRGGDARLHGRVARGDVVVDVRPSRVVLEEQVLSLRPLLLDTLDGHVRATGRIDLHDPRRGSVQLALAARGLRWGTAPGATPVVADAQLGVAGTLAQWAVSGNGRLRRGDEAADLRLQGRGNRAQLALRELQVTMLQGRLDAQGTLRWAPRLAWDARATLAGFDPGYFLPDWNGAVDGELGARGEVGDDGSLHATVDAPRLGGRLRGRALRGNAHLQVDGDTYAGRASLALGASRVEAEGRLADTLALDARFAPLQLADLLPGAGGVLRGTLRLRGARDAPDVAAQLDGSALAVAGYRADRLALHGTLPWRRGTGTLVADARGLVAGLAFDRVHATARGAVESLQLDAEAQGDTGAVATSLALARRNARWQGTLARLRLTPPKGGAWALQAPAHFAQHANGWRLASGCLQGEAGGRLCVSADWPRQGVSVDAQALSLALLAPWLPPRADGRGWRPHGDIALQAHLRPVGGGWTGNVHARSAEGGLRLGERMRRDLVGYRQLALDADFDARRIAGTLAADLAGGGRVDARIGTGWDSAAPLSGTLALRTDALTWLELFSPDIVEPTGALDARLALSGTRAAPLLGGQAQLTGFAAEVPALGIALEDGSLRVDAQANGSARVHGDVRSGDGVLRVDGSLDWRNPGAPLQLAVRGDRFLASDTRELRALVSPEVDVRYAAGQPITVTGTVTVPSARVDLERLDQGVARSPDVVVLDPADPEAGGLATPVALDLVLVVGDDVHLAGFGLDGTLAGRLRVRSAPGREMTAVGTLDVGGRYAAYGQRLTITRGELTWNGNAIADPLLDLRAEREVGDVTAGIDVSGHATRPEAEVWSDPASDRSQALALLALGRPLSSASPEESRQVDAASAALSAGGSLLASQLGARLGLDSAGVGDSRALGGSVLGIGKYLSPRLYVGYGVSLLGTGQVLTLKYLLRKGFDVEIESGTTETRASLNWRKEK
jgi:translocation and assembly module TamB